MPSRLPGLPLSEVKSVPGPCQIGRVRLRFTVLREVAGVTIAGTLLGVVAAWWFAHLVGAAASRRNCSQGSESIPLA
jgi:hypothetical protein